jgi:hypothetical protein
LKEIVALRMVGSMGPPVCVHASTFLPKAVGRLDDNEMRIVGQRLAEHLGIDLEPLVAARVEERLEALTRPRGGPPA